MNASLAPATETSALEETETSAQIVLWGFRRWIVGMTGNAPHLWAQVWNDFARRFGSHDGREALNGLVGCIKVLQIEASRPIRHYPPCCRYVSPDESQFVALVAACQQDDELTSRRSAEALVRENGIDDLVDAARRLARVLTSHRQFVRDLHPQFA